MEYERTIKLLSSIGGAIESGGEPDQAELTEVRSQDVINRQGRGFWADLVASSTAEELATLIIGLTYVEREFRWSGGSVAGTIWLFEMLCKKPGDRELVDAVSAWVIENRLNSYSPFGTRVGLGARNYSEYLERSQSRRVAIDQYAQVDTERERVAEEQRTTRQESAKSDSELRRSPERAELIERLNGMSVVEQLRHMAADEQHGPKFYPTRLAHAASLAIIESLDKDTRLVLAEKFKGKTHGPWGTFKKRLLAKLGEPWNKTRWGI